MQGLKPSAASPPPVSSVAAGGAAQPARATNRVAATRPPTTRFRVEMVN
jgi:hypothetical protein